MSRPHFVYWQVGTVLHFRCGDRTGSQPLNGQPLESLAQDLALSMGAVTRENISRELDPDMIASIQSACNPVAVSLYLNGVAKALCRREDTNQIAGQPEFRAVLLKLCDMAGIDHSLSNYSEEDLRPFLEESTG